MAFGTFDPKVGCNNNATPIMKHILAWKHVIRRIDRKNRSKGYWNIAVYHFLSWRPSTFLDLWDTILANIRRALGGIYHCAIAAVLSIVQKFEYLAHLAWNAYSCNHKRRSEGIWPLQRGAISTWCTKSRHLCRKSHITCWSSKSVKRW